MHDKKDISLDTQLLKEPTSPESKFFLNRELNWIDFDRKVLAEACDRSNPLLERVNFLSIFYNNLDEFFMVRVAGLIGQYKEGIAELSSDGRTPAEQLMSIRAKLSDIMEQADTCWDQLKVELTDNLMPIRDYKDLGHTVREGLRKYFMKEVFPVLTPMAIDPGRPFPRISNLSVNFLVMLQGANEGLKFARVKVPNSFRPFVAILTEGDFSVYRKLGLTFRSGGESIWIDDLICAHIDALFPGYKVLAAHPFRLTRNADIEIVEDDAGDLMEAVSEGVEQRNFGSAICLEVSPDMPREMKTFLVDRLHLQKWQVFKRRHHMALSRLSHLAGLDRPGLKYKPFKPRLPYPFTDQDPLFSTLKKQDLVLYHPYDSFVPVLDFISRAASDPDVLAIKQTLYRVGSHSPIVDSLMEARRNGKQVTVVVELKARFDEEQNIVWAKALEDAGVHVVYGLVGYKIHAKLCMILRREQNRLRRYVHIGTGNYHPGTAKVYSDLGLFTSRSAICSDVTEIFNVMTGFARQYDYRKILVSPVTTRKGVVSRIYREIERHKKHGDGYIAFKMNQLVDRKCIEALYKASEEGVKIRLQVRGICCLRPGVKGMSDNITVTSVVGRYLEHARLYYFRNGGDDELFMGSADLMPRNLDRRIEVLAPIEDKKIRKSLVQDLLEVHLADTAKSWELQEDGSYVKLAPAEGEEPFDSQEWMMEHTQGWNPVVED